MTTQTQHAGKDEATRHSVEDYDPDPLLVHHKPKKNGQHFNREKSPKRIPAPQHQWDDVGDRCVKCGDKDWMGGPCSVFSEPALCQYPDCKCPTENPCLKGLPVLLEKARTEQAAATDDVEVQYLVWSFQGHGSWTEVTKEMYDSASPDDRMAAVSLEDYLTKEVRNTHPQQRAAQAAVPQWQPIETAPKDGTVILVTDTFTYRSDPDKKPHHVYRAVRWYEDGGWEIYNDGEIIDQDGPTFWMPLPAEPVSMLSAAPVEQKANGIGGDQP